MLRSRRSPPTARGAIEITLTEPQLTLWQITRLPLEVEDTQKSEHKKRKALIPRAFNFTTVSKLYCTV
ncbi:hypothetical protein BVIET440_110126 [Burkholderia vietnamiensis]